MKKLSALFLSLIVLLLVLATVAPTAFAQGITGDKVVTGGDYVLRSGETLDGNLAVLGGSAEIENGATVHGDLSILGGVVTIDGLVTGNVSLLGGSLSLNETAQVDGNLASLAGSVNRAPGSVVHGDTFNGLNTPGRINPAPITPNVVVQAETPRSWFSRFINWQLTTIGSILLMGLLALVLVLVAPRAVGRVASTVAVQPGLAFVFGLLTLIVGALAGGILLIACGLGLLVWLLLAAAAVLGWIGVALWLGQRLLTGLKTRTASSIAEVLVGVALITLLSRLPCIGWLFWLIFASLGLGAVVMTRFGTQDAEGGSGRPVFAPVPPVPPTTGGSTGGDFTPLPEPTDVELAARPYVPPVVPPAAEPPAADAHVITATDAAPVNAAAPVTPPPSAFGPALTDIEGIDGATAERLQAAGIWTVSDLAKSHPVALATASGAPVGQIMLEDWIGQAQRLAA